MLKLHSAPLSVTLSSTSLWSGLAGFGITLFVLGRLIIDLRTVFDRGSARIKLVEPTLEVAPPLR